MFLSFFPQYKIAEKDLMRRTLQVSVWNHDRFGHNDFLGEVQVQLAHYVKSGHSLNVAEPVWYTLQELVSCIYFHHLCLDIIVF